MMMATMNNNGENGRSLPDGWEWSNLSEIADFIRGVSYKKGDASDTPQKGLLPILRATNIQDDKLITDEYLVYVPEKYVKPEQFLKNGDVVICMSSGSKHLVGKTARLEHNWQGSFGTFCGGLRFKTNVNSKFGAYYFQSPYYRQFIREKSSGININNLRFSDFQTLETPIPPLPEQERIVNRIEELLSDLDAGVACEGRLMPSGHGAAVPVPGELPDGWRWAKVEELAKVGTGATPLRSEAKYWNGGKIPWVTSGALNELAVHEAYEFITELAVKETNAKVFPAGSLLVAMYGEGKTRGKVSELMIDAATNQACAALIFSGEMLEHKPYVKLFFEKNYEDIRLLSSGGVQPNLNLSIIKNTRIPLPPLEEQRRFVAEVERRLSVVGEVESAVEVGLVRAGRLRQSVLRSAFEGRL